MANLTERLYGVCQWVTEKVGTPAGVGGAIAIAIGATPGLLPQPVTQVFQWVAQDLLQLVLLPVILVGQMLQSRSTDKIIERIDSEVTEELEDLKLIVDAMHTTVKEQNA